MVSKNNHRSTHRLGVAEQSLFVFFGALLHTHFTVILGEPQILMQAVLIGSSASERTQACTSYGLTHATHCHLNDQHITLLHSDCSLSSGRALCTPPTAVVLRASLLRVVSNEQIKLFKLVILAKKNWPHLPKRRRNFQHDTLRIWQVFRCLAGFVVITPSDYV